MKDVVQDWTKGLVATECLNLHFEYVEKLLNIGTNMLR